MIIHMTILGENFMHIPRLTSDHTGIYSCIVENIIGKANQSIYVDVQCKSLNILSKKDPL